MARRIHLFSKLLLVFFVACTLAGIGAWFFLMTTICANPRSPVPETRHVVPYNCHGMTVFINPFQDAMRHWLIPVEGLLLFLTLLAGAMVVLTSANVRINIDVQIHRTDASGKGRGREGP